VDADLLLHVVDCANPHFREQIDQVQRVLAEIGASDIPQILVFNKLDALENSNAPLHLEDMFEIDGIQTPRVFTSARTGTGLPALRSQIAAKMAQLTPLASVDATADLEFSRVNMPIIPRDTP
jgi:GTP-binding protein HflX